MEEIQSKVRARRDFEGSFISRLQREYRKHQKQIQTHFLDDFQKKAYIFQYSNSPLFKTLPYMSSSGPTLVCIRITVGLVKTEIAGLHLLSC